MQQESSNAPESERGCGDDKGEALIARCRDILRRAKELSPSIEEDDTEPLLARAADNQRAVEQIVVSAEAAKRNVIRSVAEAKRSILQDVNALLPLLRNDASDSRAKADELPDLHELEELQNYLKGLSRAGEALLIQPLTDNTRKNQERLLAVSLLTLLLASGLFFVQSTELASIKLDAAHPWSIALAAGLLCVYFLVAFLAGYVRDMRVYEVQRLVPVNQLRLLTKRTMQAHATLMATYVSELEAVKRSLESAAVVIKNPVPVLSVHKELQATAQKASILAGVFERSSFLGNLRRWIDLVLPVVIAVLAIAMASYYVVCSFSARGTLPKGTRIPSAFVQSSGEAQYRLTPRSAGG
jgi:hypothetical protein